MKPYFVISLWTRELKAFFQSPLGCLCILASWTFSNFLFFGYFEKLLAPSLDLAKSVSSGSTAMNVDVHVLQPFWGGLAWFGSIIIPIPCSRIFCLDFRSGMFALYRSMQISCTQILMGKGIAFAYYIFCLLLFCVIPTLTGFFYANPDPWLWFMGITGVYLYFLLICMQFANI